MNGVGFDSGWEFGMADVHFTTIPYEPKIANRHVESHISSKFVPVLTTLIVYARFEVFRTFLCVFIAFCG